MTIYNKSLREQIAGKCVHFNGMMNKVCEAGVDYNEAKRPPQVGSPFANIACFRKGTEVPCAKREWPSEEYIQARLDAIEESDRKMSLAAGLIRRIKAEHRGESWSGVEKCPVCGGKLHLSHAAYNGHVHGRCETPDCLAWME